MTQSIINTNDADTADVHIISAPYDATASFHKGTAEGPKKIIEFLNTQIEFFDKRYGVESTEKIKIAQTEIAGLAKMSPEAAHHAVVKAFDENKAPFAFLLGGEHSMSFGALKSLAKRHKPSDITIVQIDAHCDLRIHDGDYTDGEPTEYAHSAVMRRAHEMGYKLVQIGIRAFSKDEHDYFTKNKKTISVFPWGATNANGVLQIPTIAKILASIKTKKVYISIDVDGIDPAFMPGTGTPVQGGLEWWYSLKLLETVIEKKTMVGADIVEVSPQKDSVLTEYGAAQIAYNMINTFYKNRLISKKKK